MLPIWEILRRDKRCSLALTLQCPDLGAAQTHPIWWLMREVYHACSGLFDPGVGSMTDRMLALATTGMALPVQQVKMCPGGKGALSIFFHWGSALSGRMRRNEAFPILEVGG